jgi:leucyl aminopeptidase
MEIKKISKLDTKGHVAFVINTEKELDNTFFSKDELNYIKTQVKDESKLIVINRLSKIVFVVFTDKGSDYKSNQVARKAACKLVEKANELKIKDLTISSTTSTIGAFTEALLLANYQFLKYYTEKKENSLKNVGLVGKITATELSEIVNVTTATNLAKDLVNEPVSFLNATQLANEAKKMGKEAGFKVEVLSKSKIETLKMGGLLAVNKGSIDQPTFLYFRMETNKS